MVRRYAHLSESHVKGLVDNLSEDLFETSEAEHKPAADLETNEARAP